MTARRPSRRLRLLGAVSLGAFALSACATETGGGGSDGPRATSSGESAAASSPAGAAVVLAEYGLAGLSAREVVDTLDATALADRPADLFASVRPDVLLLTAGDGTEVSLPMPEDQFYVSFAPYVGQTHECYFHSLTTCTGELGGEEIDVLITDAATGEVLVDDTLTTFDNGFVGVWLPRGIEADVEVAFEGMTAAGEITTTGDDAATCITTLRLA